MPLENDSDARNDLAVSICMELSYISLETQHKAIKECSQIQSITSPCFIHGKGLGTNCKHGALVAASDFSTFLMFRPSGLFMHVKSYV